jgi:hypothetical protein
MAPLIRELVDAARRFPHDHQSVDAEPTAAMAD